MRCFPIRELLELLELNRGATKIIKRFENRETSQFVANEEVARKSDKGNQRTNKRTPDPDGSGVLL